MGSRRLGSVSAAVALLVVLALAAVAPAASASPAASAVRAQVPPLPKAFILVDADTGAVLAQQDDRTGRLPASTIKLTTALIALQRLQPGDAIPTSPPADAMPARQINVKAGQAGACGRARSTSSTGGWGRARSCSMR